MCTSTILTIGLLQVGYTHYSTNLPPFPGNVKDFWVSEQQAFLYTYRH